MDPRVDYYRRQAARCEEWAEKAANPDVKAEYKRLAAAWLALANLHHQRNTPAQPGTGPVAPVTGTDANLTFRRPK
jgi:hypothetical protein